MEICSYLERRGRFNPRKQHTSQDGPSVVPHEVSSNPPFVHLGTDYRTARDSDPFPWQPAAPILRQTGSFTSSTHSPTPSTVRGRPAGSHPASTSQPLALAVLHSKTLLLYYPYNPESHRPRLPFFFPFRYLYPRCSGLIRLAKKWMGGNWMVQAQLTPLCPS